MSVFFDSFVVKVILFILYFCIMLKLVFLRVEWCKFVMVNYEVDFDILSVYILNGMELDVWEN